MIQRGVVIHLLSVLFSAGTRTVTITIAPIVFNSVSSKLDAVRSKISTKPQITATNWSKSHNGCSGCAINCRNEGCFIFSQILLAAPEFNRLTGNYPQPDIRNRNNRNGQLVGQNAANCHCDTQ